MQVNLSIITDFPIFSQLETVFKKSKETGIDGIELVLGLKTRLEYPRILYLAEKYDLPIVSIHQPPWSGIGIYFDEHFVQLAKKLGIRYITYHPLAFHSFASRGGKAYLEKLARLQEKYDVTVMLENMENEFVYSRLHDGTADHILHHLEDINRIADTYGFLITYDVSHAELIDPGQTEIFETMFPKIGNIHASSFSKKMHHLPLTKGDLDTKSFITYLQKKKYQGLFTLEVRPSIKKLLMSNYDFADIEASVTLIKKITNKSS